MPNNTLLSYKKGYSRDFLRHNEVLGPIIAELQDHVEDLLVTPPAGALPEGNLYVGNASNLAAAVSFKTAGRIPVGDGTTVNSVPVSGDATLAANGALTVANGAITGAKASTLLREKDLELSLPTVATTGTTEVTMIMPCAGTITGALVAFKDALAQHATNWLQIAIVNKGPTGSGTNPVLAATDANTTKTSTGSAITAYNARTLTLNGTPSNLVVAAGDVLAIQFISNATLANTLTEGSFLLKLDQTA